MGLESRRISVVLTEEESRFISWLARRDGVSANQEMAQMFQTELNELMALFEEEYSGDLEGGNDGI